MLGRTTTAWVDSTWSPLRAGVERGPRPGADAASGGRWVCRRTSPGCDWCWASRLNRRFGGPAFAAPGEPLADTPTLSGRILVEPLDDLRPLHVLVQSMSDPFGPWVERDWLDRIFAVMTMTPWHTYYVLTKYAAEMAAYLSAPGGARDRVDRAALALRPALSRVAEVRGLLARERLLDRRLPWWPLPNVWLGVSIEDAERADGRAPWLALTEAAHRFLVYEPLLEMPTSAGRLLDRTQAEWLIVGGEVHGPAARALVERCPEAHGRHPAVRREDCVCDGTRWRPKPWALDGVRALRDAAVAKDVPFCFKGWGGPTYRQGSRRLDGRLWDARPYATDLALLEVL